MRVLRRPFGHWRDERPHHLRMTAQRYEAERRRGLSQGKVNEQHASGRGGFDAADHVTGAFLEPRALGEPNNRQGQPHDGDVATVHERLAEGGDDGRQRLPACEPCGDTGQSDHQQRIEAKRKAEDDDQNADERQQRGGVGHGDHDTSWEP